MSRLYFSVWCVVLLCVSVFPLSVLSCSPNDLTCSICPTDSHSRGNDIAGLPRYDANGNHVSNDLGSYQWFTCDEYGSNCVSFLSNVPPPENWFGRSSDETQPLNYAQSVIAYTIFGLCCGVLCLFGILIFAAFRYCCDRDVGGLAGGRYPQHKHRCCGYKWNNQINEYQYPPWERWGARVYMLIFLLFLFLWIGLGYFNGIHTVGPALKEVITAPDSVSQMVQNTQTPIANALMQIAADSIANTIVNISNTINSYVDLQSLSIQLTQLSATLAGVPTSLTNVTSIIQSLQSVSNTTSTTLTTTLNVYNNTVAHTVTTLTTQTSNTNSTMQNYLNTAQQLTSALLTINNSYNSLDSYTATMTNLSTPILANLSLYNTLPSNATLYNTSNTLSSLIPNPDNANPVTVISNRLALIAQVNSLITSFSNAPAWITTAMYLQMYNTLISNIQSAQLSQPTLTAMSTSNSTLIAYLFSLANTLNTSYATLSLFLHNNISMFNFTSATTQLIQLNQTLMNAPSGSSLSLVSSVFDNLDLLLTELDSIAPQFDLITTYLIAFNETNNSNNNNSSNTTSTGTTNIITTYLNTLNTSLPNATQTFNSTQSSLSAFVNNLLAFNLSNDLQQLQNLQQTITNQSLTLTTNQTFYTHALPSLSMPVFTALNLTAHINSLALYQTLLSNAAINPTWITAYVTLYNATQALTTSLRSFVQLLNLWNMGYCSTLHSLFCNVSTDCPQPNGYCNNTGIKRCYMQPQTVCDYNSDCSSLSGDYCLVDRNTVNGIITALQNVWTEAPSINTTNTIINSLNSMQQAAAALDPANNYTKSVTAAVNTVTAATANSSTVSNALTTLTNSVTSYNLSAVTSTTNNLLSSLNSINYTATYNAIHSVQNSLNIIVENNYTAEIQDVTNATNTIADFLIQYPTTYAPLISMSSLESVYTTDSTPGAGLLDLTVRIATVIENMTEYLATAPDLSLLSTDALSSTLTLRQYFTLLFTNTNLQYGTYYYFGQVYDYYFNTTTLVPASDGTGTVQHDSNGNDYTVGSICLTDDCLSNSIDYYLNTDLSTLTSSVAVSLSASQIDGLLYLIPFFIGIIAACSLLLWWSYKWSNWGASITACLIYVFLPLCFLFAAFIFPIAIVQGDVCYGGANAGFQWVTAKKDLLCSEWGGTGSATQCVYTYHGLSTIVNYPQLFTDVFTGSCDNGQIDNALLAIFNSLRSSVATWPQDKITTLLNELATGSTGVIVQPTLANVLYAGTADATQHLEDMITAIADTVTCDYLHTSVQNIQASFCCGVTTSLYWGLGSWFLIAFTLCCCGGPAAIVGRKRFAERLGDTRLAGDYSNYAEQEADLPPQLLRMRTGGKDRDDNKYGLEMISPKSGAPLLGSPNNLNRFSSGSAIDSAVDPQMERALSASMVDAQPEQCLLCLQYYAVHKQSKVADCGHRTCDSCARAHVDHELNEGRYPVLCPLSVLTRKGHPACVSPMSEAEVTQLTGENGRERFMELRRIAHGIPSTTQPSTPRSEKHETAVMTEGVYGPSSPSNNSQYVPVPVQKEGADEEKEGVVIPASHRPLPATRADIQDSTMLPTHIIQTAGGSLNIIHDHRGPLSPSAPGMSLISLTGINMTNSDLTQTLRFHRAYPSINSQTLTRTTGTGEFGGVELLHKCPVENCTGLVSIADPSNPQAICPQCGFSWCVACESVWHDRMTCAQYQHWRRISIEAEMEMLRQQQLIAQQEQRYREHESISSSAFAAHQESEPGAFFPYTSPNAPIASIPEVAEPAEPEEFGYGYSYDPQSRSRRVSRAHPSRIEEERKSDEEERGGE